MHGSSDPDPKRAPDMTSPAFTPEAILRGMTLIERVERLRAIGRSAIVHDEALGRREFESWRAQKPFDEPGAFAARLAADGVGEGELACVLGEDTSRATSADTPTPTWARAIEDAYAHAADDEAWTVRIEGGADAGTLRFLDAIEPLVRKARDVLRERVRTVVAEHPDAPFGADDAVEMALAPLPWVLHTMIQRAMVLELNAARISGALGAGTPGDRFERFTVSLRDPARAFGFLNEYPVLARMLHSTLRQWANASSEFLEHLATDWATIRGTFPELAAAGLRLVKIDGGAGDTHRDGRAVIVARFDGGARLVYKPRSLSVDVHFQELLGWVRARLPEMDLRTVRVLDRGGHGWMEFVDAAPCETIDGLRRFYRRQGALIALLFVVEAVDFHFENLIAAGEQPVLIDLESLFHARFDRDVAEEASLALVERETARSVMRIGILPQRAQVSEDYSGLDLSGLAGEAGQLTPQEVLQWDAIATDEMRARRERVAMPGAQNLPRVAGEHVLESTAVIRFRHDIATGFAEVYGLCLERREELLSAGGPIARFAEDEVRCVLRPTSVYGQLLLESFHPEYLRDGLERERFLDRIQAGISAAPHLQRLVAHERADLANGDVPLFTTVPRARHLSTARGTVVHDVLPATGLELVHERLRSLSPRDLERQQWFIQASLATLEISRASLEWTHYPAVEPSKPAQEAHLRERLLRSAIRVGERLIDLSITDGRDTAWMGLLYDDRSWSIVPLLEDLYSGVAGVVLFLAHLGAVTDEPRFTDLARSAHETYRRRLEIAVPRLRAVGAFNGLGGALWVGAHLARLWGDPLIARSLHAIVSRIDAVLDEDEHLDVVGGSAGLIAALAALGAVSPDRRLDELARRAGDRIVAQARPARHGLGWFTRIDTEQPITGFSHGAAGFAWALGQLFARTGDERYRRTAIGALEYERSMLVASEGNWLELSHEKKALAPEQRGDGALSVAWCYGAPGVGLSRLQLLGVVDHPYVREDVDIALRTTLARGFGRNHSICHGDLGNLEFVMRAARDLRDDELARRALDLQNTILASIESSGFLCGVPLGVESPSLMNGLAGIGYGLLRAACPDRVPSVLTLDSPRT